MRGRRRSRGGGAGLLLCGVRVWCACVVNCVVDFYMVNFMV